MRPKCSKCKLSSKDGSIRTEGGKVYVFCSSCSYALDQVSFISIGTFLGSRREETWVAKNMREARERRSRGEFLWSSNEHIELLEK